MKDFLFFLKVNHGWVVALFWALVNRRGIRETSYSCFGLVWSMVFSETNKNLHFNHLDIVFFGYKTHCVELK